MMRHGWQFSVLICVLSAALVGCGKNKKDDGSTRWDSFPVTIYTDPNVVQPGTTSEQDFRDAMAFWEHIVGKPLFDYRGSSTAQAYNGDSISQNSLFMQSPWSYASNIAAQTVVISQGGTINGAVIEVNPSTIFCHGDCERDSGSTSMRKVFAHELGHFLGLSHAQDAGNIMYPTALPGGSLQGLSVDLVALKPLVD